MTAHNCHCNHEHQAGGTGSPWRGALAALASPMLRLHHLRNIRTQMLRDALCEQDGCDTRGDDA